MRKDVLATTGGSPAVPTRGYVLNFGEGHAWNLTCTTAAAPWLGKLASIMNLRPGREAGAPGMHFVWGPRAQSLFRTGGQDSDPGVLGGLLREGWTPLDLNLVRIWSHNQESDLVCELVNLPLRPHRIIMMWHSLYPAYRKAVEEGGSPAHAALVERDGRGILLCGSSGTGKTTCCLRLPERWSVLCDDEALILNDGGDGYRAYPLPTWSNHVMGRTGGMRYVPRAVPISAICFLQQAEQDEIDPMGRGTAAARIADSAGQACFRRWANLDRALQRQWRTRLFENACNIAQAVPAFFLKVSMTGELWTLLDEV